MKTKLLLGLTNEQIKKLSGNRTQNCDKDSPIIQDRSALDACISGGKKIENDPKTRELLHRIYRGIKK